MGCPSLPPVALLAASIGQNSLKNQGVILLCGAVNHWVGGSSPPWGANKHPTKTPYKISL